MTLRDVLYRFLQDLLRITVIHFVKTLVVSNILERSGTFLIGFHFYCVGSTLLRCAFDFSENRGENVKHHQRKMTKNSAVDFFFFEIKRLFLSILVKNCTQSSKSTRGVLASRAISGV